MNKTLLKGILKIAEKKHVAEFTLDSLLPVIKMLRNDLKDGFIQILESEVEDNEKVLLITIYAEDLLERSDV